MCYIIQVNGSLAQLGEHLPYKQEVIGSIPITSTNIINKTHHITYVVFYFLFYIIFSIKLS